MPSYRELYFELIKDNNKYLNESVITDLFLFNTNLSKEQLLFHFDDEVKDINNFYKIIERVKSGEPYQYVLGYTTFLNSKILVNSDVLIPRQETEQLVLDTKRLIKQVFGDKKVSVLDLCTGSGCIAISLQKQEKYEVFASDISKNALVLAENNSKINNCDITFIESDLFKNFPNEKYDVIVSNPPYINDEKSIDEQVWKYEPHIALIYKPAEAIYERIFIESKAYLNSRFILSFEIGEDMQKTLEPLVQKYYPTSKYSFVKDIYDRTRFLYIIKE